jgi:hypothetical protein
MAVVAHVYHLPPRVLPSIQAVEGGAVGVVSHNTDGSDDFGVMQVNSIWLRRMSQISGLPAPEVRKRLIGDACFNIAAAGIVMRTYLNETGGNLMRAVGDYHSHTPALNFDYQTRVWRAAQHLFRPTAR